MDEGYGMKEEQLSWGDQLKDDLVPLALEYYLGVIQIEDESDEEDGDADKSDGSDEDDKKKKKGGKTGPKPEECKQQ